MISGGVLVRRFLAARRLRGRTVVVQARGVAYRGKYVRRDVDGVVLVDAQVLDEDSRQPEWQSMDGEVLVAAGEVRHVQVP